MGKKRSRAESGGRASTTSSSGRAKAQDTRIDYSGGRLDDEEVSGSEDEDEGAGGDESEGSDEETAEEKRRRLAKEYLRGMVGNGSSDDDGDASEDDDKHTQVSEKLRRERLEASGKYFRDLATSIKEQRENNDDEFEEGLSRMTLGGHKLSVTSVVLSNDEASIFSGSKDNSVIHWDTETGKKKQVLKAPWSRESHGDKQCHEGEVLAVAVTTDGKYVVSGGRDKMLRVYDARQAHAEIKCFSGHRDAITSLAFRRDSKSLFSGSLDRCLKHWDLNEMGYLETLFGHQEGVTAVDCWTKERPVSCSVDRTVRLWKVAEESHLVFRGDKGAMDAVQLVTDDSYLTGAQDGSLALWKETQKKPVRSVQQAHGGDAGGARWIASVATVKMSNLAASGSNDGYIRLWEVSAESRMLEQVAEIETEGFVNSLSMSPGLLVAGTGREHKFGRWWSTKGNKNKVIVMKLPSSDD